MKLKHLKKILKSLNIQNQRYFFKIIKFKKAEKKAFADETIRLRKIID